MSGGERLLLSGPLICGCCDLLEVAGCEDECTTAQGESKTALSRSSRLCACLQFPLRCCVLITFPRRTAAGKATWLVYINACTHAQTHTRADKAMDGWRKSQTTIRGAESGQRRTEGCNGCGPPQTGHQRKPRHGSEPRAAYQIWPQTSLRRWPPSLPPWAQRQLSMN